MPENPSPAPGPFEGAKSFVVLVREAAVTVAIVGFVALLIVHPASLRSALENAGIQSLKLGFAEIQTSLIESGKQLAAARQEVAAAQAAAQQAQDELAAAREQLDRVLGTATGLAPAPRAQLQGLSGRLVRSRDQLAASTSRLGAVSKPLDVSAKTQADLLKRLEATRR